MYDFEYILVYAAYRAKWFYILCKINIGQIAYITIRIYEINMIYINMIYINMIYIIIYTCMYMYIFMYIYNIYI